MKKTNNKGFSLVELIIVIAIMAILIGVLAPQYIKYVEKSRVSADKDTLDSLYNACTVAAADPAITDGPGAGNVTFGTSSWTKEIQATLGCSGTMPDVYVKGKLKSKYAKGSTPSVKVDSNGNFTVTVGSGSNAITVPDNK